MSLPHLLLVDDSEAVLAFGRAALAGHYQISTALNGIEAWERVRQIRPAGVLLDLSMPELDGDEVLARMQRDPELKLIPVIVLTSEKARAEACLRAGARAYLAKPVRAADLLATVNRVLEEAQREARHGSLAALFIEVGPLQLALPLDAVESVVPQITTQPLPLGPAYLCELIELHGAPILVLDLCRRLAIPHSSTLEDRQLVVVRHGDLRLALCVDAVHDPEELPREAILPAAEVGGAELGALKGVLRAIAMTSRGRVPVIEPKALVSRALLQELSATLRSSLRGPPATSESE
jgi:CheY-like chemotaxis protein/chemotaxis signal transduction protein